MTHIRGRSGRKQAYAALMEALAYTAAASHCNMMKELIRTPNVVVISALRATLKADGIEVFEFDGPIADTMVGVAEFPRRLFVHEDDYDAARAIMIELCPEEVEHL
jgi:hypothetical protein